VIVQGANAGEGAKCTKRDIKSENPTDTKSPPPPSDTKKHYAYTEIVDETKKQKVYISQRKLNKKAYNLRYVGKHFSPLAIVLTYLFIAVLCYVAHNYDDQTTIVGHVISLWKDSYNCWFPAHTDPQPSSYSGDSHVAYDAKTFSIGKECVATQNNEFVADGSGDVTIDDNVVRIEEFLDTIETEFKKEIDSMQERIKVVFDQMEQQNSGFFSRLLITLLWSTVLFVLGWMCKTILDKYKVDVNGMVSEAYKSTASFAKNNQAITFGATLLFGAILPPLVGFLVIYR
jgi:hypothetical protein